MAIDSYSPSATSSSFRPISSACVFLRKIQGNQKSQKLMRCGKIPAFEQPRILGTIKWRNLNSGDVVTRETEKKRLEDSHKLISVLFVCKTDQNLVDRATCTILQGRLDVVANL